jgi:hypothetical protein
MIATYTSKDDLINNKGSFYDPENLPPMPQKRYEVTKTYNLGFILFLLGFIMPLCWFAGVVVCFCRWKHRDINWGIANLFTSVLVLIAIGGAVAFIVIKKQSSLSS